LCLEWFAKDDELSNKKTCKAAHAKEAKEAGNKKTKLAVKANEAENKTAKSDAAGSIVIVGGKDNKDTALFVAVNKSLKLQKLQLLLKVAKTASTQAHGHGWHMMAKNFEFDANNHHWKVYMEK